MKRLLGLIFALGMVLLASAQEKQGRTITLWGHVKSAFIRQGILNTKMTLMTEDSTVVDTMTVFQEWPRGNKIDAAYKFKIPAQRATYIIKAEHPDYETTYVRWKMPPIGRNTYFDAPWHLMKPKKKDYAMEGTIGEVIIKKTRVKVFNRGDTIVYNADAFNLAEGSMLDDLIKQMPGAELKSDGQIFVNGKKIDELTLNGKDFFGNNTKVMLENLPLYTVDQLKVFNKSTDRSDWLKREVDQKKYVMDVTLKRQYNVGLTGNATLAGGTDNLWLTRLFGMRYTDNSRLIVYGSSNNVNSPIKPDSEDGSWWEYDDRNGRNQMSSTGISLMVDDKDKRFQEEIAITADWQKNDLETQTNSEQYLANGNSTFNRSSSNAVNKNFDFKLSNRFKTANPLKSWHTHANIDLDFSKQDGHNSRRSAQTNRDPERWGGTQEMLDSVFGPQLNPQLEAILVNRNQQQSLTDSRHIGASGNFGIWHKTPWGDDGGLNFRPSGSREKRHTYSQQRIDYLQGTGQNVSLYRYSPSDPIENYNIDIAPYYSINLLHGFTLYTDYTYSQTYNSQNNDTYLLNRLTGYDAMGNSLGTLPSTRDSLQLALDANNSNHQRSMRRTHAPAASLTYAEKLFYIRLYLTLRHFSDQLDYTSAQQDTSLTQRRLTIEPDLMINYNKPAKNDSTFSRFLALHYNMKETLPSLLNQVNVRNDQDPLNIRLGNPDLKGTLQHSAFVFCNISRSQPYRSISMDAGITLHQNSISQGYTYEPSTGVYTYRPMNVNGNWSTNLSFSIYSNLNKTGTLIYRLSASGNYSQNVDYAALAGSIASELSHVNNWNFNQQFSLDYRQKGSSISLWENVNYRHANQKEGTIDNANTVNFNYGVSGRLQLLKQAWVSTSLSMFSKRGYNDPSLNRNELIWNASAETSLLKNKLSLKLQAVDLLRQLSNITVNINGQGRTETLYNTLPRYVMLHLTYKFQKYPKRGQQQEK